MKLLLTSTVEFFGPKLPLIFGDKLKDMNVLCIPTAAYGEDDFETWLPREQEQVRSQVKSYQDFDIKDQTQETLNEALEDIDILYVTGGNTFYLLEAMNNVNFGDVLQKFLCRGGTYLGSSSGSIVLGPDIEYMRKMVPNAEMAHLKSTKSYNLIDFKIIPHINQPELYDVVNAILKANDKDAKMLGLRDDEALWIEDNYTRLY